MLAECILAIYCNWRVALTEKPAISDLQQQPLQGGARVDHTLEKRHPASGVPLNGTSRAALAAAAPAVQTECVQAILSASPEQLARPDFILGAMHGVSCALCRGEWQLAVTIRSRGVASGVVLCNIHERMGQQY